MPTAENAILYFEAGQTAVAMAALTDQGDHKDYRSASALWSDKSGYEAVIRPQGLATGCAIIPAISGTNNLVDVAAGTAYIDGTLTTIIADTDVSCARPAGGEGATHKINSITITNAGAIAVAAGTDGGSFSTTRGAAGGPPLIAVDSIEIGWVMYDASAAAAVDEDEIFQVVGTHVERYDYPTFTVQRVNVENGVIGYAGVTFDAAQPLIHTGPVAKEVWASFYTPIFSEVPKSSDFVPAETSHSITSKQIYGGVVAAASSSLGQGGFTAELSDGISDGILAQKNQKLWFKFYQSRLSTPYVLTQGLLGMKRSFPAGDSIRGAFTISAEEASVEVVG